MADRPVNSGLLFSLKARENPEPKTLASGLLYISYCGHYGLVSPRHIGTCAVRSIRISVIACDRDAIFRGDCLAPRGTQERSVCLECVEKN